jgi:hypothetical protein
MQKRGRGRPPVFTGALASQVVKVIRKYGITHGQTHLAEQGIKVSRPTLGKLAKGAGIELHPGRPKLAA